MDIKGIIKTYIKKMNQPSFKRAVQYMNEFKKNKLQENMVLYESFHGNSISDNPYAIFKYLLTNPEYKNFEHIWVVNNILEDNKVYEHYNKFPNVKFVELGTKEYLKYLTKSKYLINNTSFPEYFIPKEDQVYVNTWHGTPLKTLGMDMKGTINQHANLQRNFLKADFILSPNDFTTEKLLNSHGINNIFNGEVIQHGYPRIDNTLNKDSILEKYLTNTLKIDEDKEIVLYAPTWRGEVGSVTDETEELIRQVKELKSNMNSNQVLVLKVHSLIQKFMTNIDIDDVILIPNWIDTNELLAFTDILITDYSSIFFDFLVTDRPILFYMYDKEKYIHDRGVYLDIDSVPGPISYNITELSQDLKTKKYGEDRYKKQYTLYKNLYTSYDDGNVTSYYVDKIFKTQNKDIKNKSNKKNILVYAGGFLNNGVTSSLINLSHNIDYDKYNLIIIDARKTNMIFQNNVKKLNPKATMLYRDGLIQLTYKEWIEYNRFLRYDTFDISKNGLFNEISDRELKRLIGNTKIDSVVDFSGYVPFWSLVFGLSSVRNKIIYQHNDMLSESKKIIKGKQVHKANLDKIFSLYRYYNSVISVGQQTLELNRKNLKNYIGDNYFKYVPNSLNEDELFAYQKQKELKNIKIDEKEWLLVDKENLGGKSIYSVIKPLSQQGKNFINIGRLSPEKDQKKLILAFKNFLEIVDNYNHQLYIVGSGILEEELKSLVFRLGLEKNIIFTGQLSNVSELLESMDCFVSSSNHEGQPMTLLESLALKKDIIATNIPGNFSVLGDKYGYIVDNNVESLTKALVQYVNGQIIFNKNFKISDYNQKAMKSFYECIGD